MRLWIVTHQECHPPWLPFFLESVELADTLQPVDFLPPWQASGLLSKQGLFAKETQLDSSSNLLHTETEPSLWSGFATSHRRKRLRQAYGRLLLSLSQRPVYTAIKASLTRRNCVLETVKKGELWSPNFAMLPGSRIKNVLKFELQGELKWGGSTLVLFLALLYNCSSV